MTILSGSFFVKLKKRLDSSLSDPFTHCSEIFREDLAFMEEKAEKVKKKKINQENERGQCSPLCRLKKPQTNTTTVISKNSLGPPSWTFSYYLDYFFVPVIYPDKFSSKSTKLLRKSIGNTHHTKIGLYYIEIIILITYTHTKFHTHKISSRDFDPSAVSLSFI